MEFEPDDIVVHPGRLEWGYGKVLAVLDGNKIEVYFADGNVKKLSLDHVTLKKVEADEETLKIFEKIKTSKQKKTYTPKKAINKYNTLPDLIDLFLKEFRQGFQDDEFIKKERGYKLSASRAFHEKLGKDALSKLLKERDYEEACDRAIQLANKSNLIHHTEKILLNNALKIRANQFIFADALFKLLDDEVKYKDRFEAFIISLSKINVAKWPIVTYFPYLMDPADHMFMMPESTEDIAKACGFAITFQPEVNWQMYKKLLEFGDYLLDELEELNPKDKIDIQSFIWCTHRMAKEMYKKH